MNEQEMQTRHGELLLFDHDLYDAICRSASDASKEALAGTGVNDTAEVVVDRAVGGQENEKDY